MNKYYVNIKDYQGGSWAKGCIHTIKGWQERALEWCDSDENWEMYDFLERHELDEQLLDCISDIWSIDIVPFNYDNIRSIIDNYTSTEMEYLLHDLQKLLERGE